MIIYLDLCCFNRPFDDQTQIRIYLESQAKLHIQQSILEDSFQLVWSYVLDFENSHNPFPERRELIARWKLHSSYDIAANEEIIKLAHQFNHAGLKKLDALHVACAVYAEAHYFITTDDGILKKARLIDAIKIVDPIQFVTEVSEDDY